jgi:hypothetical protein
MNLQLVFLTRNDICAVMMFIESDIASSLNALSCGV